MNSPAINLQVDHCSSTEPDGLALITQPGVSISIWERTPESATAALLSDIVQSREPLKLDFILSPGESSKVSPEVISRFELQLADPALHTLLDDIDRLVAIFRTISATPTIRVRLSRVVDAACSLFHADTLSLRLLCTYHGAGTQWVPDEHACRQQLGLRGRDIPKANAVIVPNPSHIRTMPEWHVGVFKGRAFPGDEGSALIHRSYPQCCATHARIRLVLDVVG